MDIAPLEEILAEDIFMILLLLIREIKNSIAKIQENDRFTTAERVTFNM